MNIQTTATGAGTSAAHSFYVSTYRTEQFYGGPEEGGWYYYRNFLEESVGFSCETEAEDYLEKADYEAANRYNEGEFFVLLESEKGSHDSSNEPRPHYE